MTPGRVRLLIGMLVLVGIQLVPVDQMNPPAVADAELPEDVKRILERSCYDCHSNETRWPWYSQVAPVSWLVTYDVHEAREHLNFSRWDSLSSKDQAEDMEEVWEEVEEGEMPLWFYLPLHPEARLSAGDLEVLRRWTHSRGSEDSDDDD